MCLLEFPQHSRSFLYILDYIDLFLRESDTSPSLIEIFGIYVENMWYPPDGKHVLRRHHRELGQYLNEKLELTLQSSGACLEFNTLPHEPR